MAAYVGAMGSDRPHTHTAAAAAVHTAWRTLLSAGTRTEPRRTLARLLTHAEATLADPDDPDDAAPHRLRAWARELRGTGPVPQATTPTAAADALLDEAAELPSRQLPLWSRLGPLTPIAVRTAVGCALAGYASLAIGVGRPYWALVTAASRYQANITLTWNRAVQRVAGNLAGVLAFVAVVPLAHLHPGALVLCCLALNFGAEALISRNYWLGTICVTPLALLVTEFARYENPGELITDRVVDTLVGALVGLVAAIAVTNRRAGARVEEALAAVERARQHTVRMAADPDAAPGTLSAARRRLSASLLELRATTDAAAGEWWQRAWSSERVTHAEQAGHRTLTATARRHGFQASEGARA